MAAGTLYALNPPMQRSGGTVNLTTEGTLDWAHWSGGFGSSDPQALQPTRKAAGGNTISNITAVDGGTSTNNPYEASTYVWTDGDTPASGSDINVTGTTTGYQPPSYTITAYADTTLRRLRFYGGVYAAQLNFVVALSDGSAPSYVDTSFISAAPNGPGISGTYDLVYAAASEGQTLNISLSTIPTTTGNGSIYIAAVTIVRLSTPQVFRGRAKRRRSPGSMLTMGLNIKEWF